jgi:hypothetical protein
MFVAGGEKPKKKERGHVDFAASHSTHRWKQDSAENEQQEVLLLNSPSNLLIDQKHIRV